MYIVSHVPGGFSDTMGGWGREFARVVSRFENTVVGQFYGHTHQDEFIVFYEPEAANARATNVAFISPSVATWTNLNPSYTIFTTDSETHVRHTSYFSLQNLSIVGHAEKFQYTYSGIHVLSLPR